MTLLFIYIPKIAALFSAGNVFRLVFTTLQLQCFFIWREFLGGTGTAAITDHRGLCPATLYISTKNDISALWEVFMQEPYELPEMGNVRIIVDLGANLGESILFFHRAFPDATIIAVEPSEESYEKIKKSFGDFEQIKLVRAAIAETEGEQDFYLNELPTSNSLQKRSDTDVVVKVPTTTLAQLLKTHGYDRADLVKFDIEGGEQYLFTHTKPSEVADYYIGEFHRELVPESLESFLEKFNDFKVTTDGAEGAKTIIRALPA